jgi:hypothetical protein
MSMPRTYQFVLLLAAVAASQMETRTAAATTAVELGLADLVEVADRIVVARATRAESVWVGASLYTRYTLEVDDTLLGDSADATVVVPGGIDMSRPRPIAMVVPDAPVLLPGQPIGLFLAATAFPTRGDFAIIGGRQGLVVLGASRTAGADGGSEAAARARFRDSVERLIATRDPARARAAGVPAPASRVPGSGGPVPAERGPRGGRSAPLFGPGGAR